MTPRGSPLTRFVWLALAILAGFVAGYFMSHHQEDPLMVAAKQAIGQAEAQCLARSLSENTAPGHQPGDTCREQASKIIDASH